MQLLNFTSIHFEESAHLHLSFILVGIAKLLNMSIQTKLGNTHLLPSQG